MFKTDLNLDNKIIFITGGTGSFGQHLVKKLIKNYRPKKIIIFSRDELKQSEMMHKFTAQEQKILRFFLGDVRDLHRLKLATQDVDYIFHTAALKQVPTAEYNPTEYIKTNINGAENIIMAAIDNQVSKIIALSTDKAVNPINLYGATKLAADKLFIAANNITGKKDIKFSVVRYGNVVGSRGSIIPILLNIAKNHGEYFPITHANMTRFWITLEQGVNFTLSNLNIMQGGEIFVPKIPTAKMSDIATWIDAKIKHKIIGIRDGEKLSEYLITSDYAQHTYENEDRFIILPSNANYKLSSDYQKVKSDFYYNSDNTSWLLKKAEFDKMIKKL